MLGLWDKKCCVSAEGQLWGKSGCHWPTTAAGSASRGAAGWPRMRTREISDKIRSLGPGDGCCCSGQLVTSCRLSLIPELYTRELG